MITWQEEGFYHHAVFHGYNLLVTNVAGGAHWTLKEQQRGGMKRISGGEIYSDDALQLAKESAQRSLDMHLECLLLELRCASQEEWEAISG